MAESPFGSSVTASGEPDSSGTLVRIQQLKDAIWERRPVLGEIVRKHGKKNLADYARDFFDVNPSPLLDARKPQLIDLVAATVAQRLDQASAERVRMQLKHRALVSTADHHGTIDHPFFVNANIVSSVPYVLQRDPLMRHLVVFSFAGVSLNNASAYPRGILFHGGTNGTGSLIRLPILPDKLKMATVYGTRAFAREDIERAHKDLARRVRSGDVIRERGDRIHDLLSATYAADDVLSAPTLCEQITKVNARLWPTYFHPSQGEADPDNIVPELTYVEIETLVANLLLSFHLGDPETLLHRLLFDAGMRASALKHFDGIAGGFSLAEQEGTFLFWGLDTLGHRLRCVLNGDVLEVEDGRSIRLDPESIASALREKRLMPSTLFCYVTIALYYGMKCLGGFCQVHNLTRTKEAWRNILIENGRGEEAEAVIPVQTKELGGDGLVLAYYRTVHGGIIPATGIDLSLDAIDTRLQKYAERSKHVTLAEIMEPLLPEMYTVLYRSDERNSHLQNLKPEDIAVATGLSEKVLGSTPKSLPTPEARWSFQPVASVV